MSNIVESNSEGWSIKVTKSKATVKKQHGLNNTSLHDGPDMIKKIENYISKAKKLKDSEQLLCDLQEVKEITIKVYKNSVNLEWTIK
jgi:hypothetical protein